MTVVYAGASSVVRVLWLVTTPPPFPSPVSDLSVVPCGPLVVSPLFAVMTPLLREPRNPGAGWG
jgi:hypothetical protein